MPLAPTTSAEPGKSLLGIVLGIALGIACPFEVAKKVDRPAAPDRQRDRYHLIEKVEQIAPVRSTAF
jgi:hypothetical protein